MNIDKLLKEEKIKYKEFNHPPIYTVEDGLKQEIEKKLKGVACKNLFLKSKTNYYLVILPIHKSLSLQELRYFLKESRLTFANMEEIKEILKLEPGSISPLGMLNDETKITKTIIDQNLKDQIILIHPNVNTKTISISLNDVIKLLEKYQHSFTYF